MAPTIEDRYLWLGLGVFTFVAVKAISHRLQHIITLTEVHNPIPIPPAPHQSSRHKHPQKDANTIKTTSLTTLATCQNIEIRRAATKILCDRFQAHPSAWRLLLRDLKSKDPERLHTAQLAINLLADYDALSHVGGGHRAHGGQRQWVEGMGDRGVTARDVEVRDPEERDLRRRRREAMVINEGDRPISQEDVYMRDV